jgi:hypothetical protein
MLKSPTLPRQARAVHATVESLVDDEVAAEPLRRTAGT